MNYLVNLEEARKFVCGIVYEAGDILKKYFVSGSFTSKSKGGVDFLTQADQEVDDFLLAKLKKEFPHCPILTEESAPDDYSSLRNLNNLWIVDPLDGTVNFSRGNPNFAISVGFADKGIPKIGVAYLPIENKLYFVQRDLSHAFLNEKPIKVSIISNLKETTMATDFGWKISSRSLTVKWLSNTVPEVRQVKIMGSSVADLASLAEGKIDVYLHSGLKPWDTAASSLLIEKAGGKITAPDGGEWNVFNPQMLATNGVLHDAVLKLINQ